MGWKGLESKGDGERHAMGLRQPGHQHLLHILCCRLSWALWRAECCKWFRKSTSWQIHGVLSGVNIAIKPGNRMKAASGLEHPRVHRFLFVFKRIVEFGVRADGSCILGSDLGEHVQPNPSKSTYQATGEDKHKQSALQQCHRSANCIAL